MFEIAVELNFVKVVVTQASLFLGNGLDSFPSAQFPRTIALFTDKTSHDLAAAGLFIYVHICPTKGWIMPK